MGLLGSAETGAVVGIVVRLIDEYSDGLVTAGKGIEEFSLLASAAISAAGFAAADFVESSVKMALASEDVAEAFRHLSINSDQLLLSLVNATHAEVTNTQLMTDANRLLIAGIDQNKIPEYFEKVATIGKSMGVEVSQSLEAVTQALISGNDRGLKTSLALHIDLAGAVKKYADSIGKSVNDIDFTTQMQIRQDAVMKALAEKYQLVGGWSDNVSDKLKKESTAWENMKVQIGNDLIPVLGKLADFLAMGDSGLSKLALGFSVLGQKIQLTLGLLTGKISLDVFKYSIEKLNEWDTAQKKLIEDQYKSVTAMTETGKVSATTNPQILTDLNNNTNAVNVQVTSYNSLADAAKKAAIAKGFTGVNSTLGSSGGGKDTIAAYDSYLKSGLIDGYQINNKQTASDAGIKPGTTAGKGFNDFIMRPGQAPISFSPDDIVIGMKDSSKMGGVTVNIGNVYGVNATDISKSLQRELRNAVRA